MKLAIVKESRAGERRVAGTPDSVEKLRKLGFEVLVEAGAGVAASYPDAAFEAAGATVVADRASLWAEADVLLKVQPPSAEEAELPREGAVLISFLWPARHGELLKRLAERKLTVLAMDQVPRITRAQKLDALSSTGNLSGYRAVVEAANAFGRFFTGQITAAGKMPPAKVLIIGAGVAGLAAIGAARGLGAIVRAFDTRPVVREQVESLGAEFLEVSFEEDGSGEGGYAKEMSPAFIAAEMALFKAQAAEVDVIITTALIPGRPAPKLLLTEAVEAMRPGSVVVDLAAETGGNCELTVAGEVVEHRGVKVIGFTDLPSRMAPTASGLYAQNLVHLLSDMGGAEKFRVDMADEVVRPMTVSHEGAVTWPPPKPPAQPSPAAAPKAPGKPEAAGKAEPTKEAPKAAAAASAPTKKSGGHGHGGAAKNSSPAPLIVISLMLLALGAVAPAGFLSHLSVFVLACFVGWQIVWSVTPALHTPLMSVTNAISGIILVGGMLQLGANPTAPSTILGAIAVLLATINVAGGFLVTQRMLRMFQK